METGLLIILILLFGVAVCLLISKKEHFILYPPRDREDQRSVVREFSYRDTPRRRTGAYPLKYGEFQEVSGECLYNLPGSKCLLTNGMPGTCMLSGYCFPDPELDLKQEANELKLPYCPQAIEAYDCARWCNCLGLRGEGMPDCVSQCKSEFHPYTRNMN